MKQFYTPKVVSIANIMFLVVGINEDGAIIHNIVVIWRRQTSDG